MRNKKLILFIILGMSIGFAAVSTTLIIRSSAKVSENSEDFDVYFTKAILDGVDKSLDFIDDTNKVITFSTNDLSKSGDSSTLSYEVTNSSKNYDASVTVTCTGSTEYLNISAIPESLNIEATSNKSGTIKVELKKTSITNQELPITCKLNVVATERTSLGENEIVKYSYKAKNIVYDDSNTKIGCTDVQTCLQKIDNILE